MVYILLVVRSVLYLKKAFYHAHLEIGLVWKFSSVNFSKVRKLAKKTPLGVEILH